MIILKNLTNYKRVFTLEFSQNTVFQRLYKEDVQAKWLHVGVKDKNPGTALLSCKQSKTISE